MDTTVFPVLGYSLTSDTLSQVALRDLALYQLAPLLSTVSGVAKIDVQGGAIEEIHVTTDPARLAAYGLTVADLSKALAGANVLTAVGRLEDHDKLYLLLSEHAPGRPDPGAGDGAARQRSSFTSRSCSVLLALSTRPLAWLELAQMISMFSP